MDFPHAGEGPTEVGDGDGTADDERDIERVYDFFTGPAFVGAADEVVGDAVIAAEYG